MIRLLAIYLTFNIFTMKNLFLFVLTAGLLIPLMAKGDERIYDTKNICGRYFATEINGSKAATLLGLKVSGRVGSRVEQYCNFFR